VRAGAGKPYRRSHERIVGTGMLRSSETWEMVNGSGDALSTTPEGYLFT
jgi:hypothetical protein